ncbi:MULTISPECIES: ABC transporter permease [Glutamicibacter]|uniref:ABC transporter permease subunit n=1 Tax=Glutamicibacter soli TaxID=453836 RepID=A0A6L9G7V7_9MICC|nr:MULTISPECIES: ABC transporter permease [Glutamicibacter]NAZ15266.1 ABC transporter permease subunit [Glutamicibacter soli]WPR65714.1 ABC transporter permease [Glutamicibacter protophormiae]WPR69211.1 ABC transporter permease [Glutamicibacter protophormiae]
MSNTNDKMPENLTSIAEVEDAKLAVASETSKSQSRIVLERFLHHKPAMISAIILVLITLLAFTSIGYGPIPGWWKQSYLDAGAVVNGGKPTMSLLPTWLGGSGIQIGEHPFGQDSIGKDYFALVMNGTQKSIIIGVVVGLVATVIGAIIGALAGYFRGWVDEALMRITDLFIVIPLLVLAAVLGQIAGRGSSSIILLAVALGLVTWTGLARLVRGEILSLREREYVSAAQAMGSKTSRVIFKHLLPNTIGVIVVNATFAIAGAILLESSLSFLGFGVQPPESSLGLLISQYQNAFTTRPWLFWWPGMTIVAIALSVNFLGDGLRDAFDPRHSGKRRRRAGLFAMPTRKEKP